MEWFFLGAFLALLGVVGEWLEKKEKDGLYNPDNIPPSARGDNPHNAEEHPMRRNTLTRRMTLFIKTGSITKTKTAKTGKNLSTK